MSFLYLFSYFFHPILHLVRRPSAETYYQDRSRMGMLSSHAQMQAFKPLPQKGAVIPDPLTH